MSLDDVGAVEAVREEGTVFEWLRAEVKPAIDDRLVEAVGDRRFGDRLRYPFEAGGKRWRPGIAILVGRLCGAPPDAVLDVAAGVELLHTFSLVHDDVIDGDAERRGEPAMWAAYDEATAITLGDLLFARAVSLFPPDARDAALEAAVLMAEGQQLDHEFEDRRDVTVEEYLGMVERKTGALLELSLDAPQLLAGTQLELDGYASLGPAFQIRDDLLDFEPGKGRPVGADVRAGKRTLPVIHADDDRLYDILDRPFDETGPADVDRARELLRRHGSFAFAEETMAALADEALAATAGVSDTPAGEHLRELGAFLVERDR